MPAPTIYFLDDNATTNWTQTDFGSDPLNIWATWFDRNGSPLGNEYTPYWLHEENSRFVNTGNPTKTRTIGLTHNHPRVIYECGLFIRPMGELRATKCDTWGYAPHPDGTTNNHDTTALGKYFLDYANSQDGAASSGRINTIISKGVVYDASFNTTPWSDNANLYGANSNDNQKRGAFRDWAEILKWGEDTPQSGIGIKDGNGLFIQTTCTGMNSSNFKTFNHDTVAGAYWIQFRGDAGNARGSHAGNAIALRDSTVSANQPLNFRSGSTQTPADTSLGTSQIAYNPLLAAGTGISSDEGIYSFGLMIQVPVNEQEVGYRDIELQLIYTYN